MLSAMMRHKRQCPVLIYQYFQRLQEGGWFKSRVYALPCFRKYTTVLAPSSTPCEHNPVQWRLEKWSPATESPGSPPSGGGQGWSHPFAHSNDKDIMQTPGVLKLQKSQLVFLLYQSYAELGTSDFFLSLPNYFGDAHYPLYHRPYLNRL